jgi:uncharacterized protein (DUF2344 family)
MAGTIASAKLDANDLEAATLTPLDNERQRAQQLTQVARYRIASGRDALIDAISAARSMNRCMRRPALAVRLCFGFQPPRSRGIEK